MEYMVSAYSDIGIKKNSNQDSLLLQVADTDYGKVALAVVCDGMGGLSKGELASATLINRFSEWFMQKFPKILYEPFDEHRLRRSWERLLIDTNEEISKYSINNHLTMGTTVVALLLLRGKYFIINVGDSRAYLLTNKLQQITKDQTFVQKEIDIGRMTIEQGMSDPRKSVLLQCVGASTVIEPDFYTGEVTRNSLFLLCSDGFRHTIAPDEIYEVMLPEHQHTEEQMLSNIKKLIELCKRREEEDNISVILVKVV